MAQGHNKGSFTLMRCDSEAIHEDVVNQTREAMLPSDDCVELSNLYKMFSDPTRVKILWALYCNELCVCDLACLLNMTTSAISHQLKSLRLSNLVRFEKRGKEVYYSLADKHIKEIFDSGRSHINECHR